MKTHNNTIMLHCVMFLSILGFSFAKINRNFWLQTLTWVIGARKDRRTLMFWPREKCVESKNMNLIIALFLTWPHSPVRIYHGCRIKTFVFLTKVHLIGKLVHNIVCYQALKAISYVNLRAYSEMSPYYTFRLLIVQSLNSPFFPP